jgi:hypothetical protein
MVMATLFAAEAFALANRRDEGQDPLMGETAPLFGDEAS